jgi:integrase
MSAHISLQARVADYLAERRRLGFELGTMGLALASFTRYTNSVHHRGPLSIDLMAEWARHDKRNRGNPQTWARRLKLLRPFTRYLRQFDPRTEVPDDSVFGPVRGRVAPHIYREEEIVDLLAAAHELRPHGGLRPATFETLFGLIASAGLRVSEALDLLDADVDLKFAMLTVRQTKFAKSRQLPLHPSTVEALMRYRRLRNQQVRTTDATLFFVECLSGCHTQPLPVVC